MGVAEDLELDQLRVVPGDGMELVADAAGLVPGSPDGVAGGGLRRRALGFRAALLVPSDGDVVAAGVEAVALSRTQDHLGLGHRAGRLERHNVEPATGESGRVGGRSSDGVHVEVVVPWRFGVRGLDRNRGADGQGGRCENDGVMTSHQNLRRTLGDTEIRQTLRAFRGSGPLDY